LVVFKINDVSCGYRHVNIDSGPQPGALPQWFVLQGQIAQ
jgi:hypothetical protein